MTTHEGFTPIEEWGKWDVEEVGATWPARYAVHGCSPLTFGFDGEEGIYVDNPADACLIHDAPRLYAENVRLRAAAIAVLNTPMGQVGDKDQPFDDVMHALESALTGDDA